MSASHSSERVDVAYFERKARPEAFSIELVFDQVRSRLPDHYDVTSLKNPYDNEGIVNRIKGVLWARRNQRQINHVVGDVNFLALGLDGVRTVLTVHDCEFMERAGALKRWIYRWMWLELPARNASIVTVPTQATADDLIRHTNVDPDKLRIIPNPLNPVFTRSDRPFPATKPRLLQVGTRVNKNLERVATALSGLECSLVVVGDASGDQRSLMKSLDLEFTETGPLSAEEIAAAYRESDVLLFVSTKEGFGLPIIEAQATGRVVVTSNTPPLPDVAGGGACVVDPFDVESIRLGVERVLADAGYRRELIEAGFRNVERFEPAAVSAGYAAVYDELVSLSSS